MLRCLFLVSNLTFLDLGVLDDILVLSVCLKKTGSLSHVSKKVPTAKEPHKPGEHIMCFIKAEVFNWIRH